MFVVPSALGVQLSALPQQQPLAESGRPQEEDTSECERRQSVSAAEARR